MTDRTPRYSTLELIPLLNRSRQHIQGLARQYGLGIRIANRKYLFSEDDVARLRELVSQRSSRPRRGRSRHGPRST
jgi:hypothetical protein